MRPKIPKPKTEPQFKTEPLAWVEHIACIKEKYYDIITMMCLSRYSQDIGKINNATIRGEKKGQMNFTTSLHKFLGGFQSLFFIWRASVI